MRNRGRSRRSYRHHDWSGEEARLDHIRRRNNHLAILVLIIMLLAFLDVGGWASALGRHLLKQGLKTPAQQEAGLINVQFG